MADQEAKSIEEGACEEKPHSPSPLMRRTMSRAVEPSPHASRFNTVDHIAIANLAPELPTTAEHGGEEFPVLEQYLVHHDFNTNPAFVRNPELLPQVHSSRYRAVRTCTPALCGPSALTHARSSLQPQRFKRNSQDEQERSPIRLLIVVTMYNEPPSQLQDSLFGIAENLERWRSRARDLNLATRPTEGVEDPDADAVEYEIQWHEIVVVIISDGVINARNIPALETREWLADHGLWDQARVDHAESDNEAKLGAASKAHDGSVAAHIFERTVILRPSDQRLYRPLQVVFCGKTKNGGKLSSHKWFFDGFCRAYNPEFTVLIDAGTKPGPTSIVRLTTAMQRHRNIGGCCGDIAVARTNVCATYFSPVVAAQVFEYTTANYVSKAMESWFGYISVLPGAFSAYRYAAIRGRPLEEYFRAISPGAEQFGAFERNMYLAEDRIMCIEIVAKADARYTLRYVKGAPAMTDVPETVPDLMKQRRRWSNGSLFATLYAMQTLPRIWSDTRHSFFRKILFSVQFAYIMLMLAMAFILPALFYLSLRSSIESFFLSFDASSLAWFSRVLQYAFLSIMMLQLISSLLLKPNHMPFFHQLSAVILSLYSFMTIFFGVRLVFYTSQATDFARALAVFVPVSYYFMSMLYRDFYTVPATIIQYFGFLPTLGLVFQIYSMTNTHDVSWGTRGGADEGDIALRRFSVMFSSIWILFNLFVVALSANSALSAAQIITVMLAIASLMQAMQIFFALLYFIELVSSAIRTKLCSRGWRSRSAEYKQPPEVPSPNRPARPEPAMHFPPDEEKQEEPVHVARGESGGVVGDRVEPIHSSDGTP